MFTSLNLCCLLAFHKSLVSSPKDGRWTIDGHFSLVSQFFASSFIRGLLFHHTFIFSNLLLFLFIYVYSRHRQRCFIWFSYSFSSQRAHRLLLRLSEFVFFYTVIFLSFFFADLHSMNKRFSLVRVLQTQVKTQVPLHLFYTETFTKLNRGATHLTDFFSPSLFFSSRIQLKCISQVEISAKINKYCHFSFGSTRKGPVEVKKKHTTESNRYLRKLQ